MLEAERNQESSDPEALSAGLRDLIEDGQPILDGYAT